MRLDSALFKACHLLIETVSLEKEAIGWFKYLSWRYAFWAFIKKDTICMGPGIGQMQFRQLDVFIGIITREQILMKIK